MSLGFNMQKVIDYELLDFEHADHIVKYVKEGLIQGWQPYGKPRVTKINDSGDLRIFQAMVKYEDIAELLSSGVTCLNCGKAKELKSMLVCPHVMANDNIDCHSGGI